MSSYSIVGLTPAPWIMLFVIAAALLRIATALEQIAASECSSPVAAEAGP